MSWFGITAADEQGRQDAQADNARGLFGIGKSAMRTTFDRIQNGEMTEAEAGAWSKGYVKHSAFRRR